MSDTVRQAVPPILGTDRPAKPVSPERALHRLFLTLFLRGRGARGLRREGAPKSIGQKLALTLLFYALFGLFLLFQWGATVFSLSVCLHGMTFVFLGMFVASSAGEILFNKEEADILLHRPVTPRALLQAKIGVLVQVSLWLAGSLPGWVRGTAAGSFYPLTLCQRSWRRCSALPAWC
jgi:ABC-2 type transport system permease protein